MKHKPIEAYKIIKYIISYRDIFHFKNANSLIWKQSFLWFLNYFYYKEYKQMLFNENFYCSNPTITLKSIVDLDYYQNEKVYFFKNLKQANKQEIFIHNHLLVKSTYYNPFKNLNDLKRQFLKEFKNEKLLVLFETLFLKCVLFTSNQLVDKYYSLAIFKSKLHQNDRLITIKDLETLINDNSITL